LRVEVFKHPLSSPQINKGGFRVLRVEGLPVHFLGALDKN